jgi:hypothetical protein
MAVICNSVGHHTHTVQDLHPVLHVYEDKQNKDTIILPHNSMCSLRNFVMLCNSRFHTNE